MSPQPVTGPNAVDAALHMLADQLVDGLAAGHLEPCLVYVAPDADGFDLGAQPLEGMHPTEMLLGFVAPEDWYGFGMAVTGRAYDVADRASGAPAKHELSIVTLLSRSGEVIHRTHVPGDRRLSESLSTAGDELGGEQVDLLRLALDLPTPPPPCGTEVYWTIRWLTAVVGDDDPCRTWSDVTARHPALSMLRAMREAVDGTDDFVDAAAAFTRVCDWARMRELVGDGVVQVPELDAADASWLDDGAFARFVLNRCPPLSQLRGEVREYLPPDLSRQVDEVLDALGVPRSAWPDDRAA